MQYGPDPNSIYPNEKIKSVCYIKNVITRPNIIVGDYTYYDDINGPVRFEERVTHHYEFYGVKLIIGKFCQIAKDVEFIMNGVNHQMNAVSTFPFYILEGWDQEVPSLSKMPVKGDTIVGNDVWIGQNATIMPGVIIGDGAIIGANSVVAKNVNPYTVVAGNPIKVIRKRFDDELIELMLKFKWWNKEIDEINALIPLLSDSDLGRVKQALKELV